MSGNKRRKNHFSNNLKEEFPFLIQVNKNDDSVVKCTICCTEFSIANSGKAAITKHCKSDKHNTHINAAASSSKVTDYLKNVTFSSNEKNLAISEGTFAFHTIFHNHSFRSVDCTSNIVRKLFEKKFNCGRTKCEAIVVNVLQNYAFELLKQDLENANYITVLSDASNHNEIKLYPILVRYFSFETGVNIKLLNLDSVPGETSALLSQHIFKIITYHNLNEKIIALSADNTNTNFGGLKRRGENNVHKRLMQLLNKNIIGIGCNAHILSNAINTASSQMSIDVESIIPQIYLYFHRYTVRVTNLKDFCEEAEIEYKKMLGYSTTRWLSLTPAVERVIKMFEPLRSYFLSLDKCPKILKQVFENELFEVTLHFIHSQAVVFHTTIKEIENSKVSASEVKSILNNLLEQIDTRYNSGFVPFKITQKLNTIEESNPGSKEKFTKEIKCFYKNCFEYVKKWTGCFEEPHIFGWILLKYNINWEEILKTVHYMKESHEIVIDDNELFDEVRRVNMYCSTEKLREWKENKIEVSLRWIEIYKYFKNEHISTKNLTLLVEFAMCLPGTNATVERVFSIINDFWSSDKSRLNIETLSAVTSVKVNLKYTCEEFCNVLKENDTLLKKIHSNEKYNYKKK